MNRDKINKTALVTGGSRGIGREIVLALLRENIEVWYLSRSQGEEIPSSLVHWVACDIGDAESVEKALETVLEETKRIDILVNNAGITRDGLLMRMRNEAWDEVLRVNLTAVFLICRRISRIMASQRSGAIVNISSVVGIIGNGGQTNYAASKAGLIGFSKSLARELSSRSIRVNVVAPGFIETEMTDVLTPAVKEQLKTQIPLGRIGSAAEVAEAVVFFCSEAASYITGQVLAIDGGMAM